MHKAHKNSRDDLLKASEINTLSADNAEAFLKRLSAIDIAVPGRTKGRTTEHTERYLICRLLSTLAKTKYLSYPISLKKRERPDFLLCCDGQDVGIEVTEATSQDYSEYKALVERERPGHFIEPSHFRHGTSSNLEQKRNLCSQNKLIGIPWNEDEAEEEWSKFIKAAITNKYMKLAQSDFQKFSQNWLLIYNNTPSRFLKKEFLTPYVEKLWQSLHGLSFDMIFIQASYQEEDFAESQPSIIALSCNSTEYIPLKNIW